ncbi:PKD domain-containing protein [Actinomyces faecalis]|uniref:PKD domain-containing protein n=1 Tax=Actinomyces faecalis TaxID=2722820 RepID=UPI0015526E81|nr:PKD domain-containing protein [Actinomyces faecalis]
MIESEEDVTSPTTLHIVRGSFEGTKSRFAVYLPPAHQWSGRFFQYTYPLTDENATDTRVLFGAQSGAYTVQASGASGYRHAAAAARVSRQIAASYYGSSDHIYGYLYGPSGGSFQTIGAAEGTSGVWDGFVPTVMGTPSSIPHNFFIRAMGRLVLGDVRQQVSEAVVNGKDPYVGLNEAQTMMLEEMTALGVQLEGWEDPDYLLGYTFDDGLLGNTALVRRMDPTYVEDFWTKPGYLGTEASPLGEAVRAALLDTTVTVSAVHSHEPGTVAELSTQSLPHGVPTEGSDLQVIGDDGAPVGALAGTVDETGRIQVGSDTEPDVLAALKVGTRIAVDNRWALAVRSYYRHQLPVQGLGMTAYDRFYGPEGDPLFPQRKVNLPAMMARSISGGVGYSGLFEGKMILVSNLQDVDAYTWHAPWYVTRVRQVRGDQGVDERLRIYVNENADHLEGPVDGEKATRVVSYDPMVERALRDLATWVEDGSEPPASSTYRVDGGQVVLPASSAERGGVQPVVSLKASVSTVEVGQTVRLEAKAQVPAAAGQIVGFEWDHDGSGHYGEAAEASGSAVSMTTEHVFTQPGTYWVTVRATAAVDRDSAFARVQNLARARIEVVPTETTDLDPDPAEKPDPEPSLGTGVGQGLRAPVSVTSPSADTGTVAPRSELAVSARSEAVGNGPTSTTRSATGLARTGPAVTVLAVLSLAVSGAGALLMTRRRV